MRYDGYICDGCEEEFAVKAGKEPRLCPHCGYWHFEFSHEIKKQSAATDR